MLVHPHFLMAHHSPESVKVFGRRSSEFSAVKSRKATLALVRNMLRLTEATPEYAIARQETIDRMYKNSIKRISKTPGAHLVILKSRANLDPESLESRLIDFARKRLGKRVLIIGSNPSVAGRHILLKLPSAKFVPVKVFGEWTDHCVSSAANSLRYLGFYDVAVIKEKSVKGP